MRAHANMYKGLQLPGLDETVAATSEDVADAMLRMLGHGEQGQLEQNVAALPEDEVAKRMADVQVDAGRG